MNFYLVENGAVEPADADTEFDGIDSVLAYTTTETAALARAKAYDAGLIQPDNVWLASEGRAVAALTDDHGI
jgi:hypothetical protein